MAELDEKKALFVVIFKDESERQQYVDIFSNLQFLSHPYLKEMEFIMLPKNENLAVACNSAIKNTDAKYKFFLTAPITFFDPFVIRDVLNNFFDFPNIGMVGLLGSEMPISGDYTQAKNLYGKYFFLEDAQNVNGHCGKMPLYYQTVHMIDEGFFAMSGDIPFDEDVGENFVMAAQCCRYRRAGFDISVTYSESVKIIFLKDRCIYNAKNDVENYKRQLEFFRIRYKDIVTPLVSICIPTYNQPVFFEMALQSALNQTYPNIEIIVGDDSTNEYVKNMIQPYLQIYDNIKYFYHGRPLGKKGLRNVTFIVNKASGKYINVLFHDDILVAEKISRMMEYFVNDLEGKITLITSARSMINEKKEIMGRMNPLQPLEDEILNGEKVGRSILFTGINFIGELSTVLFKKSNLLARDFETYEEIFDIGIFCGVKDVAYGDMGTWLNLLKYGGECVFLKDRLSAFRRHSQQNTDDPYVLIRGRLEILLYVTISWLNNIYLHNFEEYKIACKGWTRFIEPKYLDENFFKELLDSLETDEVEFLKDTVTKLFYYVHSEKFSEVLDCSIRFLLEVLPEKNSIRPLIRQNKKTGLWEKADDGIMLHGEQRY